MMLCLMPAAHSQEAGKLFSNLRQKTIPVLDDTLRIDSLSIALHSFSIKNADTADYILLPHRSLLFWKKKPLADSVLFQYRVLPFDFEKTYTHKSTAIIDSEIVFQLFPQEDEAAANAFTDNNKLEYTGSYGRSISLGNNQDVVLNSAFNLQANGYILDSIKLEAALTDNTIPFQPEGNTQRLQEFDQIFIRLQKNKHSLQVGDYNLDTPPGYFLKFFKRVQGIYYQYGSGQTNNRLLPRNNGLVDFIPGNIVTGTHLPETGNRYLSIFQKKQTAFSNSFGVSGSVAKGQFARNIFQGLEGNQGPYKLTGNNGEQFFIVLAATERVFIDNVIMERGESADYIINYNTAEIRFMPRRMITKDSRIQVEFEYVDRSYLNSLIYVWDEVQIGDKLNIRLQGYSNQDAKNQPYLQTLDGNQKRFLATIGDSIQNAFYPTIATDTFGAGKILYRITDTLVNGTLYDSVFVYSTNPIDAQFLPAFAFVGQGRGNYTLSDAAANGRVYDWTAPVNGIKQGSYAPVQLLRTPKKQQMFQAITNYKIDSLKNINLELAASNADPNLFSKIDDNGHWGSALRLRYEEQRFLGKKDSAGASKWNWQNAVSYEYVQAQFKGIAPYRNVEFGRDWNVPQLGDKPDEHLVDIATHLSHLKAGTASYRFSSYNRGSDYNGIRNILGYDIASKKSKAGFIANLLQATDTFQKIQFLRPTAYGEYYLKPLNMSLGGRYSLERNAIRSKFIGTLLPSAFSFDVTTLYFKTDEQKNLKAGFTYFTRGDQKPVNNAFLLQNRSHNYELRSTLTNWHEQSFTLTGTYRKLNVADTTIIRVKSEETGLGRIEWSGSALKQVFSGNALYEGGAGQEQKRSYTYVEVPAGQGIYTWNDYNGDGIQQANEFELALYPDQRKFIRILTPTNDYVKVNYVNFNFSLGIEPAYFWNGSEVFGLKKLLSRFSTQSSLQIANRLLGSEGLKAYNPFLKVLNNDAIISTTNSISQSIFYNRNSAVWGIDYNLLYAAGKQLLTYGVEGSDNRQHLYKLRWNTTPSLMLSIIGKHGMRTYESALNDRRSYDVQQFSGEPALTLLYRSVFRATAAVRYEERRNQPIFGGELAKIQTLNLDARFSKPASGIIAAGFTFSQIDFNGITSTPVSFIMLEALQPGANFLWRANWERRLGKGIEIQLQYEGRKPGGRDVIHTGTMSVRAIL